MKGKSGHIKEKAKDNDGYNQFIVNCIGINDQRKYYSVTPFGFDFNTPVNTRSLIIDSQNKDQSFNIGVLSKLEIEDLGFGESIMFSTTEDGLNFVSKIVCRNNGDIEINKGMSNGNILIKADGSIEFNGNADFLAGYNDLKIGFDELKEDYNDHIHQIPIGEVIVQVTGGSGAPAVGVSNIAPIDLSDTDITSSASIDSSKKVNLKCE